MTQSHLTAEVAVRDDQIAFDGKQISTLQRVFGKGVSGATNADFALLFQQMRRTGLDPFSRQLYLIMRNEWDSELRAKVPKPTIQIGIDGFRLIAKRAAKAEGVRISHKNPIWWDSKGGEHKVWLSDEAPAACTYRIEVGDSETEMTVMTREYMPLMDEYEGTGSSRKKTGRKVPMGLWSTMPASQIAKCAEAVTLRKAFPQDLGGLYEMAEMERDGVIETQPVETAGGVVHQVVVQEGDEPVGEAPATASSEPVEADRDWEQEIAQAKTGEAVSRIWMEAKQQGKMTPTLDALARSRTFEEEAVAAS
jgi:phage recombination protein Bet